MEAVRDAYLHQHVMVPTLFRVGQRTSTLNLILTNVEKHGGYCEGPQPSWQQ